MQLVDSSGHNVLCSHQVRIAAWPRVVAPKIALIRRWGDRPDMHQRCRARLLEGDGRHRRPVGRGEVAV